MADDEDIFLTFQLHDNWLQPDHHVSVGLPTSISIVEFVFISIGKIVWISLLLNELNACKYSLDNKTNLDLFIGHSITNACIKLIQRFPR